MDDQKKIRIVSEGNGDTTKVFYEGKEIQAGISDLQIGITPGGVNCARVEMIDCEMDIKVPLENIQVIEKLKADIKKAKVETSKKSDREREE